MKRDPAVALREALDELVSFLNDRVPPALVADAMTTLLAAEAEVLAAELRSWGLTEQRIRKAERLSDLLDQALRKLQVFEELNIFPDDRFRRYLDRVTALLVTAVPAAEREAFIEKIVDLRGFDPREVAAVGEPTEGSWNTKEEAGTRSRRDFDPWSTTGVFRALADEVPDWAAAGEDGVATPGGAPLEAMYRIVSIESDRAQGSKRWEQMVRTAVEHFNNGALARAVTLIELANRMVEDGEVDEETALKIRVRAGGWLSSDRLLEDARSGPRRPLLRKLLDFCSDYSPHRLIDQLAAEEDRHHRRFLLLLLEVHGPASRQVVVDRLEATLLAPARDTGTWYLQRNLLFILNRLPRPFDADLAWELRHSEVLTRIRLPVPLVREALLFAARIPHPAASTLLVNRMREVEKLLVDGVEDVHPVPQLWRLANTLAVALARVGTSEARLALIDHALSFHPRLGNTAARLSELAGVDLTTQPEVVEVLIESLRTQAPRRMFGVTVASNDQALEAIVRALAATRTPEVRKALEEVASRYPGREFGALAREATRPEIEVVPLEDPRAAASDPSDSVLTGDLSVFGLPQLVQSLEQSKASGQLQLRGENQNVYAVFRFVAGRLAECVAGGLRGEEAFFQAFQNPSAGSFEFVRDQGKPSGKERDLFPMLMEAIRRYDELRSDSSVVEDGAFVRATGKKPTTPEEEEDGELVRIVWKRVREGATVTECELAARKDSFRVRRLLAHWVNESAAEVVSASESKHRPRPERRPGKP